MCERLGHAKSRFLLSVSTCLPSGLAKRATRRAKLCKASKNEEARDRGTTTTTTTATRAYDGERDRRKDRAQKDRWVPALPKRALREFRGVPPIPKSVLLFFFFLSQPTTPVCVDGREDAEPRGLVRARSQGLHDHRAASLGPRPHSLSPFSRATTKTRTLTEKSSFLFLSLFPLVETQASTPERTTRRAISR